MLVFEERGKPEYPEKNLSEQGENQQQTQPTYDAGSGNRPGPHWRGRGWEEDRSTRRKTSRSKERTNNKLNPHMTPGPGIEPRPHQWDASALTTAPPLLPKTCFEFSRIFTSATTITLGKIEKNLFSFF